MANFSAADVKKLRDLTGAGMMDCKKALDEADGDFDAAVEILRIKGAAKAAKRGAEREATAGLVATSGGALVELNSETDFVAKNDEFIAAAQQIADAAAEAKAADAEALKAVQLGDTTVGETVEQLAIKIGEKIELGRVAVLRRLRRRPTCTVAPPTCRRPSACSSSTTATTRGRRPRRRDADRRDEAAVPHPRRGPRGRRRQGARDRRGHRPRGGQARAGDRQDHRGPAQRLLQGRRAARPAVGQDSKKSVKAVLDEAGVSVKRFARFEIGCR